MIAPLTQTLPGLWYKVSACRVHPAGWNFFRQTVLSADAETAHKYASMGYDSVCVWDDMLLLVNAYKALYHQLRG